MKKIIGLGNALVDVITEIDNDNILADLNLPKGSMTLVDEDFSNRVFEGTQAMKKTLASGGSAANTIHGLAKLGVSTSFVGKVSDDEMGRFFRKDMESNNIKPILIASETQTGTAQALISPDAERTFATHLGAAVELSADDITPELFDGYDILYIEGYLVQNHQLLEAALMLAKQRNMEVALDLASYNVVEDNLAFLQAMVEKYVDILFANEEEAKSFTGLEDPAESLQLIAQNVPLTIVKIGKKGSLIRYQQNDYQVGASAGVKKIDTTGAGDLYAAGFLSGYVNGYNMLVCGEIGNMVAEQVIQVIGAKLSENQWESLHKHMKKIIS